MDHLKMHSGEKSNKCNVCDYESNFLEYPILSSVLCHKKADSFLRKYFSNTGISISPEEISLQDACSFHKKRKIQISNNTNYNEEEENGGDDDDDNDNNNEEEENSSATVWGHKA